MRSAAAILAIFVLSCSLGGGPVNAQTYQGRELVKAELIADANSVVAGKPLTIGLLLHMAPGWHTYWRYSGDAGLPTELKWKLPPGWKAGDLQWPIPLKLKDPGDIQTYGYSDDVMLMTQLTPPEKIDAPNVKLEADADWLVCERICIPGSKKLQVTLPVSTSNAAANSDLFDRYRKLLPQAWLDSKKIAIKSVGHGPELSVGLKAEGLGLTKYGYVDFYPLPDQDQVVGHASAEARGDDEFVAHVPMESGPQSHLRGVLVAGQKSNDPNRTGWYLDTRVDEKGVSAGSNPYASASQTASAPQARGLFGYLLFGFLGGFILNLMPCVLPVISLKIFGFVRQAGQDRRKILRSGLAFVAGIFTWFIGLGLFLVALKAAGHQVTWAAQFTNPYFILVLSTIVLVFALDLFGVFEIAAPQAVMRLAGSVTQEGDVGSFFQGIFATVLATPCTAPFLGTALGFAFTQSSFVILAMFASIAAGMSAPYFLLSAQPGWLRFLPRPGPWMDHLKHFMGFLLLATLLFLLYVLGAQRGYEALIWATSFLLVVSIACWMKGAFILPTASLASRIVVSLLAIALVGLGAAYFIGSKFRSATPASVATGGSIQSRLEAELAQGHPVFIDFTAAWCITCKFNEKAVLDSAEVRESFQRHGVTKLVADWTNGDPEITKMLQQFGRPGVPLYVLYPGKTGEPYVFPELLTKSIVLEKLETVRSTIAAQ